MRVFVTGASGWIGSAVVPELISAGHDVIGLARSEASAAALLDAGAKVQRGTLDDLDIIGSAAAASDGVIHLAFKHDIAFSGDFQGAADADLRAVEILGEALVGSDRPFVIASGTLGLATLGRLGTEEDAPDPALPRVASEHAAIALAERGVRASVVRLAPSVHGDGDEHGFVPRLIAIARDKRASGHIGDGTNRWPAVHRLDASRLFRLALEQAQAGSTLHAVADEGIPLRAIAEAIARQLNVPVTSVSPDDAGRHFGDFALIVSLDNPTSSALTRERLGWQPISVGLVDDLDQGHYFSNAVA